MNSLANRFIAMISSVLWATSAFAASETEICSNLSGYFANNQESKLADPSRAPTAAEKKIIDNSNIELLQSTDYSMGVVIVDGDNDGREDVFAWNIEGSGRFVYGGIYEIPSTKAGKPRTVTLKATMELGVLNDPRFVRFKGINYVLASNTGDNEGMTINRIAKATNGQFELQTVCQMRTRVKPETSCKHPACLKLKELIENEKENGAFVDVEWPHKYFPPAGLAVYFSEEDWNSGDFDNTGNPTTLWRFGREGYINQHIYWALLGQGNEEPAVNPKLRPESEDITIRQVLPGPQHARLRRTLAQQSEVLSRELHKPVTLPNGAEFFLFNAHQDRTYWAWDFGAPPYGEEIHITYTNAKKSDYIGKVRVKRSLVLEPCTSNCSTSLEQ